MYLACTSKQWPMNKRFYALYIYIYVCIIHINIYECNININECTCECTKHYIGIHKHTQPNVHLVKTNQAIIYSIKHY